jgi:outer membrane biosynthesis protein TonB
MELEVVAVKYVGPATVRQLAAHGITTVEQLAAMSVEALIALPGIGENTAPLILASAQEALAPPPATEVIDIMVDDVVAIDAEVVAPLPFDKVLEKQAKKAKKAEKALKKVTKKIAKQAKKESKAQEKAERKAEKKATKQAKKDEKKAKKSKN